VVETTRAGVNRRRRLGEILLEAGVLDDAKLQAALIEQRRWGGKLGRTLVDMGFLDEDSMVRALSRQLGLKVIDLDAVQLKRGVLQMLRLDLSERYGVFPVSGDPAAKQLVLASADPTNQEALSELEFASGLKISVLVATQSSIDRAIRKHYYGETPTLTASPENFGQQESTFDPASLVDRAPSAPRPPRAGPQTAPSAPRLPGGAVPAAQQELVKVQERVAALEVAMSQQVHALRTLLELLSSSGLISREEYVDRLQKD
jgi:type IV pilus assembly protein PilB